MAPRSLHLHRTHEDGGVLSARPQIPAAAILVSFALFSLSGMAYAEEGYYSLNINLPQKILDDVIITVNLPPGLIFEPGTSDVSGAKNSVLVKVNSPNNGHESAQIVWNFGRVDNSADQDIQIRFKAVLADVSGISKGDVLNSGEAVLRWTDMKGSAHRRSAKTNPVGVVEPDLALQASLEPATAKPGETITFTLSIQPTTSSGSDAYDVHVIDILPEDLIYLQGSMETTGNLEWSDDSNSKALQWHLGDLKKNYGDQGLFQIKFKAMVARGASQKDQLTNKAYLSWNSARADDFQSRYYKTETDSVITIPHKPVLSVNLADYPDPVHQSSNLTYTISYKNSGGNASGARIDASYDSSLKFISADPAPDPGSEKTWSLGDLLKNSSGNIIINLLTDSTTREGRVLLGSATLSAADGTSVQDSVTTTVRRSSPSLLIDKTATTEIIRPGGVMNYTIKYQNSGNDVAKNATVTDIIDNHLLFDLVEGASPRASEYWRDDEGLHLFWNATALHSETMAPGDEGTIELKVMLPAKPEHPSMDKVYNLYKIDSNESQGKFKTLETFVVHSLYVRKCAEKESYSPGDVINYTIHFGNALALDAENAMVTDILPDVEYLDATPSPASIQGNILNWSVGHLPAKHGGKILLFVKMKENSSEMRFGSRESVSGQGFVRFDSRLDTAESTDKLTNYVNITATYMGLPDSDSSSATVLVANAQGTAVKVQGHGSGSYKREEETSLVAKNKSIKVKTSLSEKYAPSTFNLSRGRAVNYSSKWSEKQEAKNRITGASVVEIYKYANKIERESSLSLDKNGTTLASETTFEGSGHIGMEKKASSNPSQKGTPIYESQEDYTGSFKVLTKFDEYGKNVQSSRVVAGNGSVSSDKRIGKVQRSHESGTGKYQAEDLVQTQTNYMAKNLNVTHEAVGFTYSPDFRIILSKKWNEYMWSKSGESTLKSKRPEPTSFIQEVYSWAEYLNKSTVARGLNEVSTEAKFQGTSQFLASKNTGPASSDPAGGNRAEGLVYNEYVGQYNITRSILISGVARFNEPHISVTKTGQPDPAGGTHINYVITVINDGNRALGPVQVIDLFPPGTEYVYSSARPAVQNNSRAEWTLLNLGIGMSSTIELKLNMTQGSDNLVNRVQVMGSYDNKWISAENYSAISQDWLACCPPQLLAEMNAAIDAADPMLVHYRISLKNREDYIMAATVVDQLPDGMSVQNASIEPSDRRAGQVTWNLIDILPAETRIIEYRARALQGGVYVNRAHIVAYPVNGSDFAQADVEARIEIGGQRSNSSVFGWQPPACFGLGCLPSPSLESDWLICTSCGAAVPESANITYAPYVLFTGSDSGLP